MQTLAYLTRSLFLLTTLPLMVHLSSQDLIVLNSINEDQPAGTRVANLLQKLQSHGVSVTEDASVSFYESRTVSKLFNLNDETGELVTRLIIDRDKLCQQYTLCCHDDEEDNVDTNNKNPDCSFEFIAKIRHSKTKITFRKFQVTIKDRNDNTPTFHTINPLLRHIKENTRPGEKIELPLAVDADAKRNSVIKYEIVSQRNSRLQSVSPPAFNLNARKRANGKFERIELVTLDVFDREENPYYIVDIEAVDGGNKRGRLTVNVTVEDENDCAPIFKDIDSNYHLIVKEDIPIHTVLITLRAEDCDIGSNGQITYYLGGSNDKSAISTFSVNPNSGEITNNSPLNYESQTSYRVAVVAKDSGQRRQSSEVTLTIDVEDINDNLPQIKVNTESSSGRYEVPENHPRDFIVATVKVHDPDSGDNGKTSCELTTGSAEFELRHSGLTNVYSLVTLKSFDREETDRYLVTITCHDYGTPNPRFPTSKTHEKIRVYVTDKNDNAPVFDRLNGHYFFSIDENNHYGMRIGQLHASDKDSDLNGVVKYSIDQSSAKFVSINPNTGDLKAEIQFDREKNDRFIVHVMATNIRPSNTGENFSVTATVTVSINDINDNAPSFTEESRSPLFVAEDTKPRTVIGRVYATDADKSKNKEVEFRLLNGTQFFKLSHTGELSIRRELDREKRDQYSLAIRALDNGQPRLSTDLLLIVNVEDANDNQPRFIFPSAVHYVVNLSLDFVPGNTITKVVATDADTGMNAKIKYYILGNNSRWLVANEESNNDDVTSLFSIDEDTGDLKLSRGISNSRIKTHMLHIEARDQGLKPLSETRLLQIKMTPSVKKSSRKYPYSSVPNLIILLIAGLTIMVLIILLFIFVLLITKRVRNGNHRDYNQKNHPQSNCYDDIIMNRKEQQPLDQTNMDTYVTTLENVPPECAKALLKSSQGDIYLQDSYDMLLKSKECADYYNQLKPDPDNDSPFYTYSHDPNSDVLCATIRTAKSYPHLLTNKLHTIQNLPPKGAASSNAEQQQPSNPTTLTTNSNSTSISGGGAYTKLGSDQVTFSGLLSSDNQCGIESGVNMKRGTLPMHTRFSSEPKSTLLKNNQFNSKSLRYPYDDISHV